MKRGFTLIEMLVVIGIIAILIGASIGGFAKMTKTAERAKAQELVSNVATALTVLYQREGNWPQLLINAATGDGLLDENTAYILARKNLMSLTVENGKLAGLDRFGIITPWATSSVKRYGNNGGSADGIKVGNRTVRDHILHFAIDLNGDGVISGNEAAKVGGESVNIRATAAVWCIGKSGGDQGQPWAYSKGRRRDDIYSWSIGQTQDVK